MNLKDVKEIKIPNPALKPIPSGYRQYEYLNRNPSNNAYIDLGIKATSNTNIECEFSYNDSTGAVSSYNKIIFGSAYFDDDAARITDGIILFTYVSANSTAITSLGFRYGKGNYPHLDFDQFTSGTKYKFKNEGGNVYINDVLNSNLSNTSGSFSHILGNIMIGAAGIVDGHAISESNFNLYSFKVYENNVLVKDLVPVVETTTSIAGFYDLVNNEFLSPTRGTFTAVNRLDLTVAVKQIQNSNGNIIWGSQSTFPYRRLEYIRFNGAEYIEENFNLAAKNRKIVLEYTCDQFVTNASLLAQWDNTAAANQRRLYIARCNNTSGQAIWYIGGKYGLYNNMSLNTKYKSIVTYTNANANTLTYNFKNSSGTTLESGTLTETSTSIPTIDSKAALGTTKLKNADGTISYGGYWTGKLYKFEKYVASTNTLQNNQFPCQRKSDGVCGVYDTVAQMFFPMSGTNITDAAAGPVVNEYWNLQA